MNVRCQCGTVSFKTPSDKPKALYHCHCTQCRKQSASAFGTSAVFTSEGLIPFSEELEEKLEVYNRSSEEQHNKQDPEASGGEVTDSAGASVDCYFCKKCGVRVMHRRRDANRYEGGVVMIKGGCVEGLDWTGGVHIFTKHAVWPIPEEAEQYEGAPP